MTVPYGAGAQPARNAQGFVQMPGGYGDAIAAANGGQAPQAAPSNIPAPSMPWQQAAPPTQYGQPLPPQPQTPQFAMPPQGWNPNGGPGPGYQPQQPQLPQSPQNQPWMQQPVPQPQNQPWNANGPQFQLPGGPGVDLNTRLSGPGVPPELQGRTMAEVISIHNGLRNVHLQALAGGGQQPAPIQQQTPAPVAAPVAGDGWDWKNPGGSTEKVVEKVVTRLFNEQLAPMLAPMREQSAISGIQGARAQAAAQIGPQRFAQLEASINQSLHGIDPRALMNPQTWIVAAERAAGEMVLRGQQFPGQQGQGQQPGGWGSNGQPGMYPAQVVQPGQQPMPNLNTFWSETPNQGGPGVPQLAMTPLQMQVADAMGMPHAQYMAWAGGSTGGQR